jgi:hypothetical protein
LALETQALPLMRPGREPTRTNQDENKSKQMINTRQTRTDHNDTFIVAACDEGIAGVILDAIHLHAACRLASGTMDTTAHSNVHTSTHMR